MNFQQLEYIVAVADQKHFARAAELCNVTQPTLSTMIQKLEEELGLTIFDRSKQPAMPTETGEKVIAQARHILLEGKKLKQIAQLESEEAIGELHLGIIPTLAPYLLPRFLSSFLEKYPKVYLKITELTTDIIVDQLKKGKLDAAILATPLNLNGLREQPIFTEKFVAYISSKEAVFKKSLVLPGDIKADRLWLLEEGHCMRQQVLDLCTLKKKQQHAHFEYASGSIETLVRMVDTQGGITILPELAIETMNEDQLARVRHFAGLEPHREISLVTYRQLKNKVLTALVEEITSSLPDSLDLSTYRLLDLPTS